MAIKLHCPKCKKTLAVKDHLAGKKVQCPGCKQVLAIPAPFSRPANVADIEELAAAALSEAPAQAAPAAPPQTIEFVCSFCDEKVKVNVELCGKQTPCPECRRIIKVPLLEKAGPKDWRKVEARAPAGARANVGPAPEGTWDTSAVGTVSRQALVEAQAVPQVRKRWTWQQWVKRSTAAATAIGVILFATWLVVRLTAQNRQEKAFAAAMQQVDSKAIVGGDPAAEMFRAAGEYDLRAKNPDEARNQFQKARSAIVQVTGGSLTERDLALIDLALSQVELGGDKTDVDHGFRLKWDDTQKELRQTMQNLATPEGRIEGVRELTRRLIARGQAERAAPMASQFPEEAPELLAVIGLEMALAKQDELAENLANQAQQHHMPQVEKEGESNPKRLPPTASLIALWHLLGKPERIAALVGIPGGIKESDTVVLVGRTEGLARHGEWDQARSLARTPTRLAPERFQALVAIITAAADNHRAGEARVEIEEAFNIVESDLKGKVAWPWLLMRLVKIGVQAGLAERAQTMARYIPDPALRGRAQMEIVRGRLAGTKDKAEEALAQGMDKDTANYGRALEAIARHNARYSEGASYQKVVDGWDEKFQPFGLLGVALGLQDRNQ